MTHLLLSILLAGALTTDPPCPALIAERSQPFDTIGELQPMLNEIYGQRLILMGESTHGTSEFYRWRAKLSHYLIENRNVRFIAVEGDWPALYEINRYVKQKEGAAGSAAEAMEAIDRWPLWMWRNREVKELVEWLHAFNADRETSERIGFYGIDLYAHEAAMDVVEAYLENRDRREAREVSGAYNCLRRFHDFQSYLQRVAQTGDHCGEGLQESLEKLQDKRDEWEGNDPAAFFHAEQSAKLVVNAERHIRANLEQGPQSWNIRATHFHQTVTRLLQYYGEESQGVVWAHNTHVGDARATEMGPAGMVNIGQLSRETHGNRRVYTIGFGTDTGQVLASRSWEGAREEMSIPQAQPQSWEALLRETEQEQLFLLFSDPILTDSLTDPIPHRAIGVTYHPEQEQQNNYVRTILPGRYDAFLFFRQTDILDTLD